MMEARTSPASGCSSGGSSSVKSSSTINHSSTFYTEGDDRPVFDGTCFRCNQEGHESFQCPSKPQRRQDGGRERQQNRWKKHNCAFCRDKSLWCQTHKCQEIRKLDFASRKTMLEANGDCKVCLGDCPVEGCTRQTRKVYGH